MRDMEEYLLTSLDENGSHYACWIIENRLAVGRREPSRPGATDGKFEIHFVAEHDDADALGRCSNLSMDFIPPDLEGGRDERLPCITISKSMQEEDFARAILNVAEVAAEILRNQPDTSPTVLFNQLSSPVDYLGLILEDPVMSVDAQRGLIGEIFFLLKLLVICGNHGISPGRAISSWKNEARDFSQNGITFEVKSSGSTRRIHTISNLNQLEPRATDVELHVMSVSVCRDAGAWNLPRYVDHLLGNLADQHHATVLDKIRTWWRGSRGYDPSQRDQFTNEPCFSSLFESQSYRIHPPMEPPLDHLDSNSFVDGVQPANASDIQYRLDLEQHPPPLDPDAFERAVLAMLAAH